MEVFLIVLVFLFLVTLFGYVGYHYMKEAGPNAPQLWLTGSRRSRQPVEAAAPSTALSSRAVSQPDPAPETPPAIAPRETALAVDDDALRRLREDLHGELRAAATRTREFDARLTRIEASVEEAPDVPALVSEEIAAMSQRHQADVERLRASLRAVRQRAGSYGQRQGEALASLYSSLAQVESALASVVNPMLLPGEPLTIPAELPAEALTWNTWGDVGERAYAFGDIFNQHRLMLDPTTAAEIERFIATLRQALTGSVYPTVRDGRPTPEKLSRMHAGLEAIVAGLPAVRRRIEEAYRDEAADQANEPDA